jgi:hypothetical protein
MNRTGWSGLCTSPAHAAKLAEAFDVDGGVDDGGDELRRLRVALGGSVSKPEGLARSRHFNAGSQSCAHRAVRRGTDFKR